MSASGRPSPLEESLDFEVLPSRQDVVAMRFLGRLDARALQNLVDRVERSIAANRKTHVFLEIAGFSGRDTGQLADCVRRAAPWLRILQQFGRVAIVSDHMSAAAGPDRALLPNIDCEAFHSHDRERALAWVEGRDVRARR